GEMAASSAVNPLTEPARSAIPTPEIASPNASASVGARRPEGSGLERVRAIRASASLSAHWLSADAPPDTNAVPTSRERKTAGWNDGPTASAYPTAVVTRTIKVIRGFVSSTKSEMRACGWGIDVSVIFTYLV